MFNAFQNTFHLFHKFETVTMHCIRNSEFEMHNSRFYHFVMGYGLEVTGYMLTVVCILKKSSNAKTEMRLMLNNENERSNTGYLAVGIRNTKCLISFASSRTGWEYWANGKPHCGTDPFEIETKLESQSFEYNQTIQQRNAAVEILYCTVKSTKRRRRCGDFRYVNSEIPNGNPDEK